jgi:hypothetical protein
LPLVWTTLEAEGLKGYIKRTWMLEAGNVYREIAPSRFEPDFSFSGNKGSGKGRKQPKRREVVEQEEDWDV